MILSIATFLCVTPVSADEGNAQPATKVAVKVTKRQENGLIRFFAENLERVRVTATFEPGLVNMSSSTPFPCTIALPPGKVIEVFSLAPLGSDVRWTYTLTNFFTLGDFRAVHRSDHLYDLPFDAGQNFLVSQASGGSFSHSGAEEHAIDWNMPEGTPVRAARSGIVVAAKSDSKNGGANRVFEDDANYVLIEHEDGTIANYAHLQFNGVKVRVGQKVVAGDLIALSGNTGFSSGPHLHLSVFKARNGKHRESVPMRFNVGGVATTLQQGYRYAASTREKAPLLAERPGSKGARF